MTMLQNFEIEKENIVLKDKDLLSMGIIFMEDQRDLMSALGKLVGRPVSIDELGTLGYTFGRVGPLKNSIWALYNSKLDIDFVKDVLHKRNFYTISLTIGEATLETVNHAYIRKDYIEEDVEFYINHRFNKKEYGDYSVTLKE